MTERIYIQVGPLEIPIDLDEEPTPILETNENPEIPGEVK